MFFMILTITLNSPVAKKSNKNAYSSDKLLFYDKIFVDKANIRKSKKVTLY